jgi:hypothetical protein
MTYKDEVVVCVKILFHSFFVETDESHGNVIQASQSFVWDFGTPAQPWPSLLA